jgi:hypothetical protein
MWNRQPLRRFKDRRAGHVAASLFNENFHDHLRRRPRLRNMKGTSSAPPFAPAELGTFPDRERRDRVPRDVSGQRTAAARCPPVDAPRQARARVVVGASRSFNVGVAREQ